MHFKWTKVYILLKLILYGNFTIFVPCFPGINLPRWNIFWLQHRSPTTLAQKVTVFLKFTFYLCRKGNSPIANKQTEENKCQEGCLLDCSLKTIIQKHVVLILQITQASTSCRRYLVFFVNMLHYLDFICTEGKWHSLITSMISITYIDELSFVFISYKHTHTI